MKGRNMSMRLLRSMQDCLNDHETPEKDRKAIQRCLQRVGAEDPQLRAGMKHIFRKLRSARSQEHALADLPAS